ncbi:hypothetical protein GOODEAATRI_020284 [Goodea atripinnis]|uniref:Reverse transcriptase zinc-binding domain-containing protein n=1 Tax=Goodea atripinnis TaxID=208336 RepID=A0ABV0NM56_9TELE
MKNVRKHLAQDINELIAQHGGSLTGKLRCISLALQSSHLDTVVGISRFCWRNCGGVGDFTRIFWDCPKLVKFWEDVQTDMKNIASDCEEMYYIYLAESTSSWHYAVERQS